jgi:hypothetical protein
MQLALWLLLVDTPTVQRQCDKGGPHQEAALGVCRSALEQGDELQDDEQGYDDPDLVEGVGARRPDWVRRWKLSHVRIPSFPGRRTILFRGSATLPYFR